jgi:Mrp family chromosome partitioning ATPase
MVDFTELESLARRLAGRADRGRAVMLAPVSKGAGASAISARLADLSARISGRPSWLFDLDFAANPQASSARLNGQAFAGELSGLRFWRAEPDGAGRLALRKLETAPVYVSQFERTPGAVRRLTFHPCAEYWRQVRRACGLAIVDAPHGSAAMTALAGDLDGVILIADAARSRRADADALAGRIEDAGGRVLGVVVNRSGQLR